MEQLELEKLCEARNILCDFCENYEACDFCQITLLINQAYAEHTSDDEDE